MGDPHLKYLAVMDAIRRRNERNRELRRIALAVEDGIMTPEIAMTLIMAIMAKEN